MKAKIVQQVFWLWLVLSIVPIVGCTSLVHKMPGDHTRVAIILVDNATIKMTDAFKRCLKEKSIDLWSEQIDFESHYLVSDEIAKISTFEVTPPSPKASQCAEAARKSAESGLVNRWKSSAPLYTFGNRHLIAHGTIFPKETFEIKVSDR